MGIRGKTSGAELSIVGVSAISADHRLIPPRSLTEDQISVWLHVVNSLPADWIRQEAIDVLEAYCRHVVAQRKIAALIAAEELGDEIDLQRYDRLLAMQDREGRALSSLATRLRLTPQSTYDKTKAKRATSAKKPWSS